MSKRKQQQQDFVEVRTRNHTYTIPAKYAGLDSVSAIIRAMAADGWSRASIAKTTNIRYQHVRNVLITPVGK